MIYYNELLAGFFSLLNLSDPSDCLTTPAHHTSKAQERLLQLAERPEDTTAAASSLLALTASMD
jgi:hypothetical protein